ncbi:MAG: response regulator, partial [Paracoccaceae bacterium]
EILSFGADDETLDYIAQFVAGLARSAGDAPLEAAAQGLALQRRAGHPYLSDLARVTGLVQDRLATNRMVI